MEWTNERVEELRRLWSQGQTASRIAELLGVQGIVVARRTVAKYRELLHIPAVALRRTL